MSFPRDIHSWLMGIGPVRRQSFIAFGSSTGITLIGFFATIYIAHTAGASAMGAFFLLLAYVGIFGLFTDGGTGGAALQRISEGRNQDEFYSAHAIIRVVLLAATITVIFLIHPLMVDLDQAGLFHWLVIALIIATIAGIVSTGVYGSGKAGVLQVADFINNLVRIGAQVLAVYLGYLAAGLAAGFVAGILAGLAINYRFLSLKFVNFGRDHVESLIRFSGWAFITALTGALMGYADTILVGYFLSNSEVGLYRTAFQLTLMGLFAMTALRTALYPKIASWWKNKELILVESSLARAFSYSLALAVPAATGAWVLGGQLLYYLYGSPFAAAGPAMAILFGVQIITVFLALETMCLGALDQPREVFRGTAAGAVVTIVLDLLLIPRFGINGAAIALLIGTLAFAIVSHFLLTRHIRVFVEKRTVGSILFASVVMAGIVLLYQSFVPLDSVFMVIGAVITGMVVYGVILIRLDPGIREEVRCLVTGIGIPWPG